MYICQVTILSVFRHHFRRHRSTPLFYISKVALGPKKQLEVPTAVLGGHRWTPLFYISKVTLDTTEKPAIFRRFRKTVFEAFWDAPRNHQFYCMNTYISVLWDPQGFRSKPPCGFLFRHFGTPRRHIPNEALQGPPGEPKWLPKSLNSTEEA